MVTLKNTPLDAAPVTIPDDKPEEVLIEVGADGLGHTIRGRKGYRNHFVTCPDRDAHRKPRSPRR